MGFSSAKERANQIFSKWRRDWHDFSVFGVNKADSKVWGQRIKQKTRQVDNGPSFSGGQRTSLRRMVSTHQFGEEMKLQLRDESVKLHYSDVFRTDCDPPRRYIRVFSFGATTLEYVKLVLGVWAFLLAWLIFAFWKVLRPLSTSLMMADLVIDFLYALCLFVQLQTTMLQAQLGMEICRPRKIIQKHVTDRCFWLDILSCCPLIVLENIMGQSADAPSWIVLLKSLRGWRIMRLPPKHRFVTSMAFLLARIFLVMLMGGHFLACFWFLLVYGNDTIEQHINADGWKECFSFIDTAPHLCVWRLYSISLNQGIYLLMGIDREAYSALEHFFLTVCMPLGALFHALVLGEVILMLQRHGALETRQNEHSLAVQEAMRILGLPPGLQVRIITYFTFERLKRCGRFINQFFTDLSPQLRFELQLQMYSDLVVQAGLFRNVRPRVLREIVMQLQDLIFLPGDWICRYGDYGDSMYFIVMGDCTIIAKDAKTKLKDLSRGSYFGEVALLTGVARTASVLATSFCIVAHLTKAGFEPIMKKWPEEIDTLLGHMENEADRAKIKEEATKHYDLAPGRRNSLGPSSRRASNLAPRKNMRRRAASVDGEAEEKKVAVKAKEVFLYTRKRTASDVGQYANAENPDMVLTAAPTRAMPKNLRSLPEGEVGIDQAKASSCQASQR
jgi:CRP-like cAMP-binding protein